MRVGCDDLPQNRIVDTKIRVTNTVADALYLPLRPGREVREPVVRNLPHTASEMVWIA
jgi:hypothetical protein